MRTVAEVAGVPIKSLPDSALDLHERNLTGALALQRDVPHPSTLPPAGEMVARVHIDPTTGAKETRWFGKQSFIRDFTLPGSRIARLMDPTTRNILPPMDRMDGFTNGFLGPPR
jgi:hypothetical protein